MKPIGSSNDVRPIRIDTVVDWKYVVLRYRIFIGDIEDTEASRSGKSQVDVVDEGKKV